MVDGDQVLCGGDSGTPPTACFADIWINVDGGTLEIPNSTTLPGLPCNAGEIYMDTDATSGQQLYGCEAGSWVLEGDGAGGGVGDMLKTTYDTDNNGTVDDSEALEGISLGTLTDTKVCTYDLASLEIDCNTDVGAGDMTKLVYDTDDDGTVNASESDVTWTLHNNYPAACSAGKFVTEIGDILTCEYGDDPRIGNIQDGYLCVGIQGGGDVIDCTFGSGIVNGTEFDRLDNVTATILTNLSSVSSTQINATVDSVEYGRLDGVTATILTNLSSVSSTQVNANVSATEFGYLDGVTSALQTQLDGKQASGTYLTNLSSVSSTQIDANVSALEYSRLDGVTATILTNLSSVGSTQIDANVNSTEYGYLDGGIDISGETNLAVSTPITLTGDSVGMVNQGTTAQVLHGNAAGNPAFSAIVDADVPDDITVN